MFAAFTGSPSLTRDQPHLGLHATLVPRSGPDDHLWTLMRAQSGRARRRLLAALVDVSDSSPAGRTEGIVAQHIVLYAI